MRCIWCLAARCAALYGAGNVSLHLWLYSEGLHASVGHFCPSIQPFTRLFCSRSSTRTAQPLTLSTPAGPEVRHWTRTVLIVLEWTSRLPVPWSQQSWMVRSTTLNGTQTIILGFRFP